MHSSEGYWKKNYRGICLLSGLFRRELLKGSKDLENSTERVGLDVPKPNSHFSTAELKSKYLGLTSLNMDCWPRVFAVFSFVKDR